MTIPFSAFEKMPRGLRKVNARELTKIEKKKWVVTEKIHGANFSFVYETATSTIRFARRRDYLDWNESFFGFQILVAELEERIQGVFDEIAATQSTWQWANTNLKDEDGQHQHNVLGNGDNDTDLLKIIIYGELFGGSFPHPDVPGNNAVKAVQTGVYYSPNLCFCAFDIAVETASAKLYLPYDQCVKLWEKHQIFYAKPLLIGSLTKALNFNTRIDSTIPEALGLPRLSSNLIEGVVVKLYSEAGQPVSRFVFKTKNKELDEDDEYRQAERYHDFVPEVESPLSVRTARAVSACIRMVTPLRLVSAISKVGPIQDHAVAVKGEVRFEILSSLDEEAEDLRGLSQQERQWVERRIDAAVDLLIVKSS
jgi:Rnl2 family RNA ligase